MDNIYLCGFMGCGKSTIGRQLARQLGRPFVDLDKYIVDHAGLSIPEIFDRFGEAHFRGLETDSLKALAGETAMIIATGGGAFMREENIVIAKENGRILFLNPPFGICYSRIKGDQNRPLVMQNTREQLHTLYKQREAIYRTACDLEVNDVSSPLKLTQKIVKLL